MGMFINVIVMGFIGFLVVGFDVMLGLIVVFDCCE